MPNCIKIIVIRHPAIIEPDVFDVIQCEMKRGKEKGGHHSGDSCFSGKIICGECGHFFGSKVGTQLANTAELFGNATTNSKAQDAKIAP